MCSIVLLALLSSCIWKITHVEAEQRNRSSFSSSVSVRFLEVSRSLDELRCIFRLFNLFVGDIRFPRGKESNHGWSIRTCLASRKRDERKRGERYKELKRMASNSGQHRNHDLSVGFLTRGTTTCTYMPIASPSLTPLVLWIYIFSETIVPWLRRAEHSPVRLVRALHPIVAAPFAEIQTEFLGTRLATEFETELEEIRQKKAREKPDVCCFYDFNQKYELLLPFSRDFSNFLSFFSFFS